MDAQADEISDLSLDQIVELERRAEAREAEASDESNDTATASDGADDGTVGGIVLPWYQNPINIMTLIVTAAILAGMIGWMVGDNGARIKHNDVDTGFLQDMRVHHEQATLMSAIYRERPDTDPGLRRIAYSILQGQNIEIGRMIQLLREFGEQEARPETEVSMLWMGMLATPGQMPGIATDEELDQLGAATGEEADQLFVDLMSEHHLGGIDMAEFAVQNGENGEVVKMAAAMAGAQRGEILEMATELVR